MPGCDVRKQVDYVYCLVCKPTYNVKAGKTGRSCGSDPRRLCPSTDGRLLPDGGRPQSCCSTCLMRSRWRRSARSSQPSPRAERISAI